MALKKAYKLPWGGTDADYWRVLYVQIDIPKNQLHITTALYMSAADRAAGRGFALRIDHSVELPSVAARKSADIVELAYNSLKIQPEFQGASDV